MGRVRSGLGLGLDWVGSGSGPGRPRGVHVSPRGVHVAADVDYIPQLGVEPRTSSLATQGLPQEPAELEHSCIICPRYEVQNSEGSVQGSEQTGQYEVIILRLIERPRGTHLGGDTWPSNDWNVRWQVLGDGDSFAYDPNPNSFNNPPNDFTYPPQPQYESYSCELCGNDSYYGYDCPPRFPLNKMPQILRSIALAPVSSIVEPKNSLNMGDEHLSTIPEKESDEVIKSSIENLVPISSEFEDTSESDSECDDFSSIDVPLGDSVTFSNPLFDSNDEFASSDDELLPDE
ncbi:hypothetical protein Tco_0392938 [Tanacetum coccineum]